MQMKWPTMQEPLGQAEVLMPFWGYTKWFDIFVLQETILKYLIKLLQI